MDNLQKYTTLINTTLYLQILHQAFGTISIPEPINDHASLIQLLITLLISNKTGRHIISFWSAIGLCRLRPVESNSPPAKNL